MYNTKKYVMWVKKKKSKENNVFEGWFFYGETCIQISSYLR